MSVYSLDIYRLPAENARRVLKNFSIRPIAASEFGDGSIVLEYETWHGFPYDEFEKCAGKCTNYLYLYVDNDACCYIDATKAIPDWEEDLDLHFTEEGLESFSWKKFGKDVLNEAAAS